MEVEHPLTFDEDALRAWNALPEDCVSLIASFAPGSFFKTRLILALVNRDARNRYDGGWLQPDSKRLSDALKPIARKCPLGSLLDWSSYKLWNNELSLRIATFGPCYYETMKVAMSQLTRCEEFLANYRYKPVAGNRTIALKHSDYKALKPVLTRLYKYFDRLRPHERLASYMDLQAYGYASTRSNDIAVKKASSASQLNALYLRVAEPGPEAAPPAHWSGQDLRRLMPLETALGRGIYGNELFTISGSREIEGTLSEHWRRRVARLDLLRRPLKELAKTVRKRHRDQHKKRK